jgi:hypothetical protein
MFRRKFRSHKFVRPVCGLVLEPLENRLAPANWTGAGGDSNFNNPQNWDTLHVPGASDAAVIGAGFAPIQFSSGSDTVLKLTAASPLNLSGGTLTVTSTLEDTSSFKLAGGTLSGATVMADTTLTGTGSGGTLGAVTLNGNLDLSGAQAAHAYVTGGLTLNGALELGLANGNANGDLYFEDGAQTLSGTGTVTFGASTSNALDSYGPDVAATLTIASGITVQGGSGSVIGFYPADSIVNDGTITIPSGQALAIGGSSWVNNGTITANGATLTIQGNNWVNAGTITATGATVNLGGSLTITLAISAPATPR